MEANTMWMLFAFQTPAIASHDSSIDPARQDQLRRRRRPRVLNVLMKPTRTRKPIDKE